MTFYYQAINQYATNGCHRQYGQLVHSDMFLSFSAAANTVVCIAGRVYQVPLGNFDENDITKQSLTPSAICIGIFIVSI